MPRRVWKGLVENQMGSPGEEPTWTCGDVRWAVRGRRLESGDVSWGPSGIGCIESRRLGSK